MSNQFNTGRFNPSPPSSTQESGFRFWYAVLSAWLTDQMRNPLFATLTLFVTGGLFAFIVMASYPDGQDPSSRAVPIITAERTPYKEAPEQAGGLYVPHTDSTVFQVMRGDEPINRPVVENLLAPEQTDDGFEETPYETAAQEDSAASALAQVEPAAAADDDEPSDKSSAQSSARTKSVDSGKTDTETAEAGQAQSTPADSEKVAGGIVKPKPKEIHPAGSSPETIEFVRSILDKEKETAPEKIEPAAGTPASSGNTYLQLGSIRNRDAAPQEWSKLQKTFSALDGLQYRVQKADLGAKGIYYRIQAGPMTKDKAQSLCGTIKAQKPGGCLVVQ